MNRTNDRKKEIPVTPIVPGIMKEGTACCFRVVSAGAKQKAGESAR
jgi:hypothetical protein